MADLRKLKDKAAAFAERGKFDRAASVYRDVLLEDPDDVASRQKRAEVLRRAERLEEAIAEYSQVAERFGKDGLLVKAIAICKTILELDEAHVDTQSALAGLYAARTRTEKNRPPRRATLFMHALKSPERGTPQPPPGDAGEAEEIVSFPLPGPSAPRPPPRFDLAKEAEKIAAKLNGPPPLPTPLSRISLEAALAADSGVTEDVDIEDIASDLGDAGFEVVEMSGEESTPTLPPPVVPPVSEPSAVASAQRSVPKEAPGAITLPRVPIFSDLSREAFLAVTSGMVLHRFPTGALVVREGDEGTSFYVVASGCLAVSKRDDKGNAIALAKLSQGDFFGEMAILSGSPRAASVITEAPSEVLELSAALLLETAKHHPHVAVSLRKFYRQRLLANAMAASPVLRPLAKNDRKAVMEKFLAREVKRGDVVVREGERSDGLYVILEGAVDIKKRQEIGELVVGHLSEGDLFGEMSCLRKTPATATVVVARNGTILRLPRSDFDELVLTYPQILEIVSELSDERLENLDAILSGHATWTAEGLVLV